MANDTKKINDLVPENDDDTSELEVLTATVVFNPDLDYEAESDAATHSFDSAGTSSAGDDEESIAALKSDLQRREENIGNLQYDIEELRARWTGLEKELKAREALTDNITTELEQSNRKLAQTISLLKKRDGAIAALESTLKQQQAGLAEADSAAEQARQNAEAFKSELAALDDEHRTATARIAALDAELSEERSGRAKAEEAEQAQAQRIEQLQGLHGESQSLAATLQQYIEGRKSRWERQDAELKLRGKALKNRKKEVARLTRDARTAAELQRKDQGALQRLSEEHAILRSELEQLGAEAIEKTAALSAAEQRNQAQQEEIGVLLRQAEETGPALEQERAARRILDEQLAAQQQRSDALARELAALQEGYAEKDAAVGRYEQAIGDLTAQVDGLSERLAREEAARNDLEGQLDSARAAVDGLRSELSNLEGELAQKDREASGHQERSTRLADELASVHDRLGTLQSAYDALSAEHDSLHRQAAEWQSERDALNAAVEKVEALERARAELSGLVSSSEDTVRELTAQLAKTEGYADVLRGKLQQQQTEAQAAATGRSQAEASLAVATGRIEDLTGRLEAEQQQSSSLRQKYDDAERQGAEQVRLLVKELDDLKETLREAEGVAEQLTSDLVESVGSRRALETRLAEADETRDREIQGLSKQVARLRQQIDDYERKISTKDAAINALLSELAHKPENAAEPAADDVVHRLADRRPASAGGEERVAHEKDRVTRLLIGSIDGQELRFPLFKDKLTIGRTVHNDIQLKAQYVSRRHAVVVTEDDQTRIVDWGSKNGLYVNGRRVTEVALKNGDRVTVGTAEFKFEERPKR